MTTPENIVPIMPEMAPAPVAETRSGTSENQVHVNVGGSAMLVTIQRNGVGTAAGVLGIVGMALILVPFLGGLLCLLSAIMGGVGIKKGRDENLPTGMAITGLVLGLIGIGIYFIVTIMFAAASAVGSGAGAIGLGI